jgi:hypothetical protein
VPPGGGGLVGEFGAELGQGEGRGHGRNIICFEA